MKRICPRCNEPLSSNCYVKDKGINTLSYLELIIKKDQFQKENKEIKSCYCSKCGYVELYIDIDDSNKHHNKVYFLLFHQLSVFHLIFHLMNLLLFLSHLFLH